MFVTGTDFYGRKWATLDDRGNVLEVKDHRAVFRLKHRTRINRSLQNAIDPQFASLAFSPTSDEWDQKSDVPSDVHAALARLCRITSCFPGAFAPVTVGTSEPAD